MKLSHIAVLALLLLQSAIAQAEVYRWINEAGIPEYSEHPREGAEKVDLGGTSSYTPAPYQRIEPRKESRESVQASAYTVAIVKPVNDEAFLDNRGNVEIELAISPPLNAENGHKIELWVDDSDQVYQTISSSYTITGVERGTHTLSAQIRDGKDKVVGGPVRIIFHLRHHSSLFNKPAIPH